ncbi:MAG: hypothetical protein WD556_08730 [Actinomycetota bacterium]
MRALLEFLGLVEPERGRRDPVALPAWTPAVLLGGALVLALLAAYWVRGLVLLLFP